MGKKRNVLIEKVKQENLEQKSQFNQEGIKSFIRDAGSKMGKEYSDDQVQKIMDHYGSDYNTLIDEAGKKTGIKDLNTFRNKVYTKYGFSQPNETEAAEMDFVKTPVAPDPEGGFEKYKSLEDELKLTDAFIQNIKSAEPVQEEKPIEELSDYDRMVQKQLAGPVSDVTKVPTIDQTGYLKPTDPRVISLEKKAESIKKALDEQAAFNIEKLGYANEQHEAIEREIKKNDSLLADAIQKQVERSEYYLDPSTETYQLKATTEDIDRVQDLKDIRSMYNDMSKLMGAPRTDDKKMKSLLYGFGNNFFTKDFATLGITEINKLTNVKQAFEAKQKLQDELLAEGIPAEKIENEINNRLPEEQRVLLDTYQLLLEIQAGADPNKLYYWGEGLKEMIPFIIQFAATGGSATGAKTAVTKYITQKTKSAAIGKIAGIITKPTVQAAMMVPMNLQGYAERVAPTMDENGNLVEGMKPLQAALITYMNTVAEVVGEDVGSFTNKYANKAARNFYATKISGNPSLAQEFLGKMALRLTSDTGVPTIQGVAFEGLGEEVTGLLQAVINQDDSFFTSEAQKQIWGMSLIASGAFMSASAPNRIKARTDFNKSKTLLDDIPNAEYANSIDQLALNYENTEDLIDAWQQVNQQFGENISNEDKLKARNYIEKSIVFREMNNSRAIQIQNQIKQNVGQDGNVTMVQYEGLPYSVRNPQDIGKEGKVIFLKNPEGIVKPIISSNIDTETAQTKTPDEIIDNQISAQDQHDGAVQAQEEKLQATMEDASRRGLEEGKTVNTPQGKKTLVSINPDGTSIVVNDKGEESTVNTDEIEAYKTQEQKEAEKAEQETLKAEAEGQEVVSDEPLFEGSDVRVIDYANGTSSIITPEGEQTFETTEERDAAISELAQAELDAVQSEEPTPEQVFSETYKEDPELAVEALRMEVENIRSQAEEIRAQAKESKSSKERVDLLKQAKELEAQAAKYEEMAANPPVEEEPVIERTPEEIIGEYEIEKENTPDKKLLPWQEALIGRKVSRKSFQRFGDLVNVTQTFAKSWFAKNNQVQNSNNIDVIAQELSQLGTEVTPDDVVNFMLENPTASVRKTTDRMIELEREYKELTGESIKKQEAVPTLTEEQLKEVPFRAAPETGVIVSEGAKEDLKAKTRVEPTLNELQNKFGIPIQVINSSEMPEHVKQAAKGKQITAAGFYDPSTGSAYMISDNIRRISDLKKTFMHEAVLHKGLDMLFDAGPVNLLGKSFETKNELLDEVFKRLDQGTISNRAEQYLKGVDLTKLTDQQKRELAEEAMATLNETESPRLQVLMDKLYNFFRKLFGFTTKQFTKAEFRQLLRDHRDLILKQKKDAETVRSDEGQVYGTGNVRETGTEEGGPDLQQQEKTGTETGDKEQQVRFRDSLQEKDLVVLHNLSGDNILHSDRLGGIPVPSLAITRKHIPFTGFGEITLIGDVSMVDPKIYGNKTFAADAYSPRSPKKLFDVGRSGYDKLYNNLVGDTYSQFGRDIWNEVSNAIQGSNLEREIQEYSPEELVNNYKDRLGLKIAFLGRKNIPLQMPMVNYKLAWNNNNGIFDNLTNEDKQWIKDNKELLGSYFGSEDIGTEKHKALTEFFKKKAIDDVKERYDDEPTKEDFALSRIFIDPNVDENGLLYFAPANTFLESIVRISSGKKKPDKSKLRSRVNNKFNRNLNKEYEQWLYDNFNEVQGAEYFESGKKKIPYNLDNLVDAMTGKIRGQENTIFKSLAGARAKNVKQFTSVSQMQKAKKTIIRGDEVDKIKEELNNEFFNISNNLDNYYEYSNRFGQLDDLTEVIADYIKSGNINSALTRNGFKNTPDYIKEELSDFANKLMATPTQYFESKPQRAVSLSEFTGAVVPKGTNKEVIQALRNNGVTVNYYEQGKTNLENEENRKNAIEQLANRKNVMFRVAESTDELNEFISDSKIKETVYHGTPNAGYDEFREGTMFTKNKKYAERYTNQGASSISYKRTKNRPAVYSAKINLKNPFDTRNDEAREIFEGEYQAMYSPDITTRGLVDWLEADDLAEFLKENYPEYDGIILDKGGEAATEGDPYSDQYENISDGIGWRGEGYFIFNADQALIENIEDIQEPKFQVAPQTESEAFKNWFGNSKTTDENGKPIVYYHATGGDFDVFKTTGGEGQVFGKGIIFASPDPKWAQEGFMPVDKEKGTSGSVMPVYVKSDNPFDYRNQDHLKQLHDKIELRDKAKGYIEEGSPWGIEKPKVVQAIKELGFDGLYVTEEGTTNIGVFDPVQIKSATGNVGTFDPKNPDVRFKVEEQRDQVEQNPSDDQKHAGNYKMGHVRFDGFDISIENPKGGIRQGVNDDGEKWSNILPADYGYFKGTIGKDKDHIDVFMGDNLESDKVYVVDQINPNTGEFDEHKVLMGYNSLSEARNAYMEAYDEGWQGLGNISRTTKEGLKDWFKNGNTKKPFSEQNKINKEKLLTNAKKGYNFVEKQGVYETNEPNEQLSLFREETHTSKAGKPYIQWKESEAKVDDTSITFSERLSSENPNATLIGEPLTGAPKIYDSNDVANLFSNLENASSENVFAVLRKSNGDYKVLYVSTGATSGAIVENKHIIAAAKEYGASSVTLVHNHPSGNLMASTPDFTMHNALSKSLENINVNLDSSVIINLDSGQYSTFNAIDYFIKDKKPVAKEEQIPLLSFDKQKLYIPSNKKTSIKSQEDVALFLSKVKRGTTPHIGIIILDRKNNISRYSFVDESIPKDELRSQIAYELSKYGESVILSSNTDISSKFITDLDKAIKPIGKLLDVVVNKLPNENVHGYNSIMMEPEVRFQVTSNDPKIQAMLDKLAKVQAMSQEAAKLKEMKQEAKTAFPQMRQTIDDQILAFKAGLETGKADTKKLISEVQKTITDYAKKVLPLTEAGAREISPILTLVRNAQTPEDIESAVNKIDELAGRTEATTSRRKNVAKVNRLLKWMTGLKTVGNKKVGKFNYEDTSAFQELKDIDKQTSGLVKTINSNKATPEAKAEAEAKLDEIWNNIDSKENKNSLDEAIMKLIELRKLGSKSSPELAQIVADELEEIYRDAKDAKTEADVQKALTRKEDKEFVKEFLRSDKSLDDMPFIKKAIKRLNTWTGDIMGNWETLMTMVGGQKLRDKTSLMLNEAEVAVGRQESMDNVLNSAKEIYGEGSRTSTLNKIHDLSAEEYSLRPPNTMGEEGEGDPMKLSKLDIMDIYNATKNEDIAEDYYLSYGDITLAEDGSRDTQAQRISGKERIDALVNNLSPQDKALADAMMDEIDSYYDRMNEVHIKLYNRDLPRVEGAYWPSTVERESDIDLLDAFTADLRYPGSTKERSQRRTPKPTDAFNKFAKHVDEAQWFINMALPINDVNKLFKDINIKRLIEDKRGDVFYKNITQALQNVSLMAPGKMQQSSKLTSWLNPLLNNWVASKIGATPSVPLKQLLSSVNYAENMPAGEWAGGFIKGLANPSKTWSEMMEIPYLKTRLGNGYSEAVQRALNGDDHVHKSRVTNYHSAFKNLMTIGTRYGDIAAIVFGGKPYLDYLIKKEGLSEKEAVDKFLQDTLRSQQSPFSSTLSKLQNSKNPFFRALFAFSNTPSQYMRKLFEAQQNLRVVKQQYKDGKVNEEEFNKAKKTVAKAHTIYGMINTVTFTMAGALINSLMKGSDPDDEVWRDILNQLGQTYLGGLPVIKDAVNRMTRQALGMKVYDESKPFIEGIDQAIDAGIKLSTGEAKNPEKEYNKVAEGFATMLGVPLYNIKKDIKAIPPFREKTVTETRIKEVDEKLKDLKDSDQGASDLKQAYSNAKGKATRYRNNNNPYMADIIDSIIEDSKLKVRDNNYENLDTEAEWLKSMFDSLD